MMDKKIAGVCFAASLILLSVTIVTAHSGSASTDPLQALVVTTKDWNSVEGTLQRYERSNASSNWKSIGAPVSVVVGRNGMGWGLGLNMSDIAIAREAGDPIKKEGDGKAPAGIFNLGNAFGYAREKPTGWKQSYVSLSSSIECVDDPNSYYYNRVVDRNNISPDWKSSEHMLRPDDQYKWGIMVEHNAHPPRSGAGSCIFLHIWSGPTTGTVGCTAMPEETLQQIQAWLEEKKKPVLIQLPVEKYQYLEGRMNLPALTTTLR